MAHIFSSFHVCGPSGAQYLAASTSSRAFSGHVDGSKMFTRVGARIFFAIPRPTIVTQKSGTHQISVNWVECLKQESSDAQPQMGQIQAVKVVVVEH